jgi:hypothetical protein
MVGWSQNTHATIFYFPILIHAAQVEHLTSMQELLCQKLGVRLEDANDPDKSATSRQVRATTPSSNDTPSKRSANPKPEYATKAEITKPPANDMNPSAHQLTIVRHIDAQPIEFNGLASTFNRGPTTLQLNSSSQAQVQARAGLGLGQANNSTHTSYYQGVARKINHSAKAAF